MDASSAVAASVLLSWWPHLNLLWLVAAIVLCTLRQ